MKKIYVVSALEASIQVVKANSKEEAFDIFTRTQLNSDSLEDGIDDIASVSHLYDRLFSDDSGNLYSFETNERIDETGREEYIKSAIEKNVKDFWKDEPHYATEYLDLLFNSEAPSDISIYSEGLKQSALKKFIQEGDWYEHFSIVEINLEESDHQVIYSYQYS